MLFTCYSVKYAEAKTVQLVLRKLQHAALTCKQLNVIQSIKNNPVQNPVHVLSDKKCSLEKLFHISDQKRSMVTA